MYVTKLRLRNYAQFEDRTFDLDPGLVAVVGPNGSGKSNLLGAIEYLLLGEIPTAGTLASNKRQGAKPRDQAFGELTFVGPGGEYQVTRYLSSQKSRLVCPDGSAIDGDTAINSHILSLLDVSREVLRDVVFVRQEEMFGFLAHSHAPRAERLAKLFSLEKAEAIWGAVGRAIPSLPKTDFEAEAAKLSVEEQELAGLRVELHAEQQRLAPRAALTASWDQTTGMLATLRAYQKALQDIPVVERRVADLTAAVAAYRKSREQFDTELATLAETAATWTAQLPLEQTAIREWSELKRQFDARAAAHNRVESAKAAVAQLPQPRPERPGAAAAALQRVSDITAEITQLSATLSAIDDQGCCPTCHRRFEAAEELRHNTQTKLADAQQRYAAAATQAQSEREYEASRQHEVNQLTRATDAFEKASADLAVLPVVTLPAPPATPASTALQTIQQRTQQLRQAIAGLGDISSSERQLQTSTGELAALREVVSGPCQVSATEAEILQLQAQLQEELAKHTSVEQRLTDNATRLTVVQAAQAQLDSQRRAYVGAMYAADLLGKVQAAYHKKAGPADAIVSVMESATPLVNELLECFQSGYAVRPTTDLSFDALFPNGVVTPASRLSGGQRVVLAIAFRIAIHFLRAGRLGFLLLDEPTTFLDDQHVSGLEPVLEQVRRLASRHRLQCLMATHEPKLAPYFDQVIDLG